MKTALITGHEGFVGRHLYLRLLQEGWQVTGADPAGPVPTDALDIFRHDRRRYDLVVHCAARTPHRAAIDGAPANVGAANLELDAAMFRWALRAQPDHLVYLSSSAVYPTALQTGSVNVPLREEQVVATGNTIGVPDAIYGWTKLTGEVLSEHYRAAGGQITVVRPFSGYGTDQSAEFPFGAFRDRALSRVDPFTVWGNGQQVRDFIHVDDLVGAILAAVASGVTGPVNLCTGIGTSMVELATLFCEIMGYSPQIKLATDAPAGVNFRVGDSVRMRSFYQPQISLAQGVALALERRY